MNFTQFIDAYNLGGLLIGLATFVIIGIFHPLVIKGYYYFGLKCRIWFLIAGLAFLVGAVCVKSLIAASLLGVTAFSCFWSIKEVTEQAERVRKGWFPANPRHPQK
jgi:peptidoglycan/LPS O-acetylase OafA/YrhL